MYSQIVFKQTTPNEIDQINDINYFYWGTSGIYSKEWLTQLISQGHSLSYFIGEELISYCIISKREQKYNISFIAVRKGYTGKGLGKKILIAAMQNVMEKENNNAYNRRYSSKKKIIFELNVAVNNYVALGLYEKLGFKIICRIQNYYKPMDPKKVNRYSQYDSYYMQLIK